MKITSREAIGRVQVEDDQEMSESSTDSESDGEADDETDAALLQHLIDHEELEQS